MKSINLNCLITDKENIQSYIIYREIEDWCHNNIPKMQWKFDYSGTICVCGIDIPHRIFFQSRESISAFRLNFNLDESLS